MDAALPLLGVCEIEGLAVDGGGMEDWDTACEPPRFNAGRIDGDDDPGAIVGAGTDKDMPES